MDHPKILVMNYVSECLFSLDKKESKVGLS